MCSKNVMNYNLASDFLPVSKKLIAHIEQSNPVALSSAIAKLDAANFNFWLISGDFRMFNQFANDTEKAIFESLTSYEKQAICLFS